MLECANQVLPKSSSRSASDLGSKNEFDDSSFVARLRICVNSHGSTVKRGDIFTRARGGARAEVDVGARAGPAFLLMWAVKLVRFGDRVAVAVGRAEHHEHGLAAAILRRDDPADRGRSRRCSAVVTVVAPLSTAVTDASDCGYSWDAASRVVVPWAAL